MGTDPTDKMVADYCRREISATEASIEGLNAVAESLDKLTHHIKGRIHAQTARINDLKTALRIVESRS